MSRWPTWLLLVAAVLTLFLVLTLGAWVLSRTVVPEWREGPREEVLGPPMV